MTAVLQEPDGPLIDPRWSLEILIGLQALQTAASRERLEALIRQMQEVAAAYSPR